ncbi:TetR/AcrR family transcriptional regulator [Burkholderia gladioli]|uniref:TetR/AcrR family transcriptional regulator n=1 Tax=Burkholderia gladioli TaxID=28095 RepID=UPI00163E1F31|nr:TetR/AcrR family transcriptional regulator [Burkholderia gladioli]
MSGKPQYDEAVVIDAAIQVFWRHGYAAASISDLTEATGLSRSSLYQRFRDKDGLFQVALATYTERVLRRMNSAEGGTAREKLQTLLRGMLPVASPQRPPGCLLTRSCAERVDLPPAGQEAALDGVRRQREVLVDWLNEAVAGGELPAEADVEALAWHFLGVCQAVLGLPQAGAGREVLERMIEVAMGGWPVAGQARRNVGRPEPLAP